VRIAVGTDSRASNPDLSVLSELRHIRPASSRHRTEEILKMGTLTVPRRFNWTISWSLSPGKQAAFAIVPLANFGDDPFELLLRS